ncbi:YgfZ/GcvT domain-containing protein [Pseudomonadota bacterium]
MNIIEAAVNECIVTNLLHYGVIKIEGEDAQTFLHNQFTNDLKQGVTETQSQLSAYCSPKGRILTLFRILRQDNDYYMIMPKATLDATIKRLRMFVLMSKVTLSDISDEAACIGYSGPESEAVLKKLLGDAPANDDELRSSNGISAIRIPGLQPRFELFGPKAQIEELQQKLRENTTLANSETWELLSIQAGIPSIHAENVEAFVPQMINLQAINGLSFQKGCYPGQEIVARMQYLGKLKRRMYLLRSTEETVPQPGDAIFTTGKDSDHKAGTVVMAQRSDVGTDLLAVIEIAAAENDSLHLESTAQPALEKKELPYSLE